MYYDVAAKCDRMWVVGDKLPEIPVRIILHNNTDEPLRVPNPRWSPELADVTIVSRFDT